MDEQDWRDDLRLYIQQRMINFLIKKKLNPEEKEILKGVVEVYINRLMNGELEKHSRAKAWTQILENVKRLDNE